MKHRVNEEFKNLVVGKEAEWDRLEDCFISEYNNGKFITEMRLFDNYAELKEINIGPLKIAEKIIKVDKVYLSKSVDSNGDIFTKKVFEFNGSITRKIPITTKKIREKFPTLKEYNDYTDRLKYSEPYKVVEFYTPKYITTVRTIDRNYYLEFDKEVNDMLKAGWEIVS